jgi:prophage tail gpP-like protein
VTIGSYDSIGTVKDTVELVLGDEFSVQDPISYDVACSIFSQPSAFTLTFGWGQEAGELLERFPKGTKFQLRIAGVPIQTGLVDSIGSKGDAGGGTVVSVRGRDMLRALYKDTFIAEKSYSEATHYELTRKMMTDVGLGDLTLHADNAANRKAITGHKVIETKPVIQSDLIEVESSTTSGQRKIVLNKITAKLGERRYDFLQRHYKKAGLFLWAAGDGSLVLSRPNPNQEPGVSIVRQRGQTRNQVNVKSHSFDDGTTDRFYRYLVYGRSGRGKAARAKCKGEWIDPEMEAAGFRETKTIHDQEIKSDKQALFAARREGAMAIRNGWRLEYIVAGHLMPSLFDHGAWSIWACDTVVSVVDDENGLKDNYWVGDLNFRRDMGGGTTTTVKLMRRDGLVFGDEG